MAAPKSPAGAKSDKLWRDALMRAVRRRHNGKGSPQRLDIIAEKCADEAMDGNMIAIKEIGDRMDGRPAQAVQVDVAVAITRIDRLIIDPLIEGETIEHEPDA